ncbi:hypothetical protein D3273_13620 [Lichenibacterium minor]|uniref:Uncharacterized protein n=1 Tax=Lichenibacterium minor TaxID=2316528 RepID=A0A4Q2U4E1_9HYPH|nr:hypothetical protein [Lichenibacterium minor]RYC31419.1 hypothetical protein D3273_13620 [Lichenibacterium minor]
MLDRDDIEADLARGQPEDIRDAFDALVRWDGASGIRGMARAGDLMALFERVSTALLDDDGRVPPDTVRALLRGRGTAPARGVATYGDAARFALAARRSWWPAFAASFPDPDGAPEPV